MPRALLLLIRLQTMAWLRYLTRNLTTPKGILLALLGLPFLFFLVVSLFLTPAGVEPYPPESIRSHGPAVLLLYCLVNVLLSSGERAVYFSPAEVQFLFAGPFGRRQLLVYKILSTLMVSVPSALVLGLVFRLHAPHWYGAVAGMLLVMVFMQLFGMALNLTAVGLGARLYSRTRRIIVFGLLLLGLLLFLSAGGPARIRSGGGWWDGVETSLPWRVLTWPLRTFAETFLAERVWPDLVLWLAAGLGVNVVLLGVVFYLDADYLEATAASSSRIYARIQRLRGGKAAAEADGEAATPAIVRWSLPMPPFLGGAGPIFWRQLLAGLRQPSRLMMLGLVFVLVIGGPLLGDPEGKEVLGPWLGLFVLALTAFMTRVVPFDFRGDLDRLAVLRTLPIPTRGMVLGQLLPPVLLVTAVQWLVLGLLLAVSGAAQSRLGLTILLGCVAFSPPWNFLLFGLENLLFLLFPTRLAAGGGPGDFQSLGRNVLFMIAKMVSLGVTMSVALVVGVVAWLVSNQNLAVGMAAAWVAVVLAAVAVVPFVALAFEQFDVTRDVPP
jgi:hypothetical protein